MNILWMVFLFIFGAVFGSFACCQVWRIRKKDKAKFSHCMHCKYQLQWYDNIPIISWLSLGGKCRKCKKKIGYAEILAEVGLAVAFVLSFVFWPNQDGLLSTDILEIVKFAIFLIQLTIFTVLFIYDAKWCELPLGLMLGALGVAVVFECLVIWPNLSEFNWLSFVGGLLILPGFYFVMYKISNECWVGGGDWILCLPLAVMLADFWLGLMCVFAANVIGSAVMLPVAIKNKNKKMKVPFGPFLILGFLVVFFAQELIFNLLVI